ncbi:MAG TPA: transglutaminase domain-containing protein [Rhodanobacteraceae bacterium]|nr:transglutaminase domain-containing protein [Rhodanobacteraceae bacterium]
MTGAVGAHAPAVPGAIGEVIRLVDAGQFTSAETRIAIALADQSLAPEQRSAYAWQRERMRRIRLDFSLDRAAAEARVRAQVAELSGAEFADWDAHGYLEHLLIDGQMRWFRRGTSNLFLLSEAARARRATPMASSDSPLQTLNPYHVEVVAAARQSGQAHLLPRRFHITQSLTVNADAVPDGETLRVWIPYPQELPGQQEDLRFMASVPAAHQIAPAGTAQRTVYLEQRARKGQPTVFKIDYALTVYAQYTQVDPARVAALKLTPDLAPYVAERPPHIVFTQAMRVFSRQIVGDETNPWRIAQKLYAAVDAIPWAGAREYSTISNLSDYTLHAGHGDCGQQTLLLMTLLRLNGIPTRWQSGAMFSPGDYWNIHDWGWLYIAPYGWLPMDVTFGRLASADAAVAGFYLGGLDGYRVAFNNDYGQPLVPAKHSFRSDNVDSQRGEVEWQGGNLYYDQWDYDFVAKPLSSTPQP